MTGGSDHRAREERHDPRHRRRHHRLASCAGPTGHIAGTRRVPGVRPRLAVSRPGRVRRRGDGAARCSTPPTPRSRPPPNRSRRSGSPPQRASTIVWDRSTGEPIGPGLGWQDLRTIGECLTARAEHDLALAPNQSATKIGWLLAHHAARSSIPPTSASARSTRGSPWTLTEGAAHVTDHTNAAVTGLYSFEARGCDPAICADTRHRPLRLLPAIVDSTGVIGPATALPGSPPLDGDWSATSRRR